jgi:CRP-like cAMP-binding protein
MNSSPLGSIDSVARAAPIGSAGCAAAGVLCQACGLGVAGADGSTSGIRSGPGVPGHDAAGVLVRLRAGQVLYGAGQRGDAVFVLHRGLVKEMVATGDCERVVRLVRAPGVTGLAALLGEPHRQSATVMGDGHACRVPVRRLRDRIAVDPRGSLELMAVWQAALDERDHVLARFASGPARARLARYVLVLVEALGTEARLRRHEVAQLIGVTPVSVTRLIAEFKRDGLMQEGGMRVTGCDRQRLIALARLP